jgi:penicillin-binding protein 1C
MKKRAKPIKIHKKRRLKVEQALIVEAVSTSKNVRRSRILIHLTKKRLLALLFVFIISVSALSTWVLWGIPLPDNLSQNQAVSTKLLDRNGKLIYEIYADQRRTPVKLTDVPPYLKEATISIEDKDFYKHGGFSVTGILRAAYKTVFQQQLEGGSTLTQQLVKSALLTPERTVRRKLREFFLSVLVEARYSKDQILELYLNQIPYGSTAYGIESASQLYFGKSSKNLDLAEASLLAGLTASPTRYSPFGANPELAKERQKIVLRRMVEDKYISQDESDAAYNESLAFAKPNSLVAPHFSLWVKDQLASMFGDITVEQGGLRVTTTLDLDLQASAEAAVAKEVGKLIKQHVGNGAAIVTYPKTGEILAMVGSKDYFATDEDGKVNIIFANRQPGSSIKPLNYVLALRDKKITLSTPLADIPTCFAVPGQEAYCPVNYDGTFHGAAQVRFALGNSYNVPAVRVLALNGLANFVNFARDMGLTTFQDPKNYGLSLTLGGGEVRAFDMAEAYGVFANAGVKQQLYGIKKVEDWKGKVLYENNTDPLSGPRVLEPNVTYLISHALQDNNARTAAFGPSSFLNVSGHPEVSVKTGTTNDRRDNWTIGFTPYAVVAVWVGNNDNSPMSGAVSGVSGASPIWNTIIKNVLDKAAKGFYSPDDKGPAWPKQPDDVVGSMICANTGFLQNDASNGCPQRFEFYLSDTVPANGATREDLSFDRSKNVYFPNSEGIAPENLQTENHLVVTDPLGTKVCLDCAFPMGQINISYPVSFRTYSSSQPQTP